MVKNSNNMGKKYKKRTTCYLNSDGPKYRPSNTSSHFLSIAAYAGSHEAEVLGMHVNKIFNFSPFYDLLYIFRNTKCFLIDKCVVACVIVNRISVNYTIE